MVPQVQVPMDFGVKYLGSPSHGNLKFRLKEGGDIPANSMIISYNSPVIESLTTDLMQTSVDVDDFSEDAVQCFLESCYSGKLQRITRTNFRDANKMSNVFEVAWLVKRCFEYFGNLLDEMDTDSFEDQNYLFEEAMFMWGTLKNRNFVEVVIKRFSYEIVKCDQFFVPQYLRDLPSHTTKQLDMIIEMVGKQKHVLMEVLNLHFDQNNVYLDKNTRYVLENVSFSGCSSTHRMVYEKMFENLEAVQTPSKEDYKLMLRLFKQADNCSSSLSSPNYTKIPNWRFLKFRHIIEFPDLIQLMDFLAGFPLVNNSYIFFDAVHCWVFDKYKNGKVIIPENAEFVEKFIGIISKRGWKPLVAKYLKGKSLSCLKGLIEKIEKIPDFKSYKNYSRIVSVDDYSPQEFFQQDNDLKFYFKHPNTEKCQYGEKCGFIIRSTALFENVDDSFDLQFVIDPKSYPNDIHFNSHCVDVANMHIALSDNTFDYPISWSGKPSRDGSNKHFIWGQHLFFSKKQGNTLTNCDHSWFWWHGSNTRIRLVVYQLG